AYLDQHHAPTLPEEESAPATPARGRDARGPRIATVPRTSEEAAKEAERATRRDARPARRDTAPRSAPSRPGKRDRGAEPAPATDQFEDLPTPERAEPTHEPFTGPWPVFEELLATTMEIAEERVDPDLTGDAALAAIRDFTLGLYKQVLESL